MYVYVYACICMYHLYVYVCVKRPCNAPATPLQHPCMCMYMCMYVYVSFIYVLYEECICMYESVWVSMMCSVAPFDTIFPLRPIQIGCLDHDLSTALFPSQHTASNRARSDRGPVNGLTEGAHGPATAYDGNGPGRAQRTTSTK